MNLREIQDMLSQQTSKGHHVRSCLDALAGPTVRDVGTGRFSAREALIVFSIRQDRLATTLERAIGLQESLAELSLLDSDRVVLLRHFKSGEAVVTVFVTEDLAEFVGCFAKPAAAVPGSSGLKHDEE